MASNFFKVDKGVTLAPQSSIASPQNGDVYYDSTRNTYVFRNNGASVDLQSRSDVGTASSLTSANFTATVIQSNLIKLTGSTVSNIHGITASSDAKMIVLYNGSSAVVTIKNASGTEATAGNRILTSTGADVNLNAGEAVQLTYDSTQARWIVVSTPGGSANGGTGKNYLTTYKNNPGNGNFESASTTGWSLGTTGTLSNGLPTGSPTFGSGASGNLSISTVSSGQLAGSYSLSYASSAATTQGNMLASDAFSIDLEDQAKVLTWKFYYKAQTNPSNANWSGTSSNSFGVAVYDVTNSAWLGVAGQFSMTQNSGIGISVGTFQTAINTAQLRFVLYNVNATSGAVTLYLDDFSVGPQTAPIGPVVTDWVAYTPTFTGFGTPTNVAFYSRRVGDTLEVHGHFNTGTPSAVTNQITLGYNGSNANVTINTNKIYNGNQIVGSATVSVASTTRFSWTVIASGAHSYIGIGAQTSTGGANGVGLGTNVVNTSGDQVEVFFTVPIVGWSSNVQMSNDTDTRVISFSGGNSSQALTAGTTNISLIATKDTAGSWSGSTYVVPVSGDYFASAAYIANGASTVSIYKNGALYAYGTTANITGQATNGAMLVTGCVPGDTISFRSTSTVTVTSISGTIFRLSGPSVIAATESVNARYTNSSGQTIANSTITQINSWTRDFDSHNAFASNAYVVPVSGKYQVNIKLLFAGTSMAAGGVHTTAYIYVNGTAVSSGEGTAVTNASEQAGVNMSDIINVNAGDSITVRLQHSNGGNRALITIGTANTFSISRVGN